ncbi:MAG: hypothetical protein QOH96_838 [Blastocatellia bacterium]|nr:hypothetical protein [Blastocatellia bacterium]
MFTTTSRLSTTFLLVFALVYLAPLRPSARSPEAQGVPRTESTDDANSALEEGKSLLRRYQADQAYKFLQTALDLFTRSGDKGGVASVNDAMGDLYTLNGQYDAAIRFYRTALDNFRQTDDVANSNAMLAKIGEHYFLLGDLAQARASFAAMTVTKPGKALEDAKTPAGKQSDGGVQVSAFAATAAASLSSCMKTGNQGNNTDYDPANPPNQGHSPATPYGSGRLDLRITNEQGEPIKGVKAQLQSKRPGDIYCDCWDTTDDFGRALMPPLHIAPEVKLVLNTPGLPSQKISLKAADLASVVRVVLSKAGAKVGNQIQSRYQRNLAAPCFNFYRALIAYATSELGRARADFYDNKLSDAKTRYEDLITQLDLPGLENLKEIPLFRTAARTALGDIAFKEGRLTDAASLYNAAANGATKDGRPDLLWAAQRGLGRTFWLQSSQASGGKDGVLFRNNAFIAYQSAIKTIETIRAGSLRADEARSNFLASTKDVYDEAGALLAEMALAASGANAATDAGKKVVFLPPSSFASNGYQTIEEGRARSLLEMLGDVQAGITEGVSPELLKRRNEIIDRQQEIADSLMGVSLPGSGPVKSVSELEVELQKLGLEYDALENQIRTANPRYASLAGSQMLSLGEVQQKVLDANTVLLMYSLGTDESYLWVVTSQKVAVARIASRKIIEDQVLKLRSQLVPGIGQRGLAGIDLSSDATRSLDLGSDGQPPPRVNQAKDAGAYAVAANDLYNTILGPAATMLEGKRLLVMADGALNYVPFGALVTSIPAGKADFVTLPYLIRTNEIVYAPSASVINQLHQQAQQVRSAGGNASSNSMLILADPVFSSSDVRLKGGGTTVIKASDNSGGVSRQLTLDTAVGDIVGKPSAGLKIPRLINTRKEANDISELAGVGKTKADVWLDLDASESNVFSRDMRGYQILHFATHGLLNTEHPGFTGLVLSLVSESQGDGFLRVSEIFNLKLGAPLVMLSACETGLGKEKRGEGIMGLSRAFMYAGAPTVGVSLWAVSDRSTARLMTDFYASYLADKNTSAAGALRQAQLKMISDPQVSAPYYWAPFVIVGDWAHN